MSFFNTNKGNENEGKLVMLLMLTIAVSVIYLLLVNLADYIIGPDIEF